MSRRHNILPHRLRGTIEILWRELAKFGVVGAVCFVIDAGGTNLLFYTVLTTKLTTAKIIAGSVATLVSWVGNRYWTFQHRRTRRAHHELLLFLVVNGIALGVSAAYLAFTHYALGMGSVLAINLNNVIGIGLGTLFRFSTYRRFIFKGDALASGGPGDQDPGASDTNNAKITG